MIKSNRMLMQNYLTKNRFGSASIFGIFQSLIFVKFESKTSKSVQNRQIFRLQHENFVPLLAGQLHESFLRDTLRYEHLRRNFLILRFEYEIGEFGCDFDVFSYLWTASENFQVCEFFFNPPTAYAWYHQQFYSLQTAFQSTYQTETSCHF